MYQTAITAALPMTPATYLRLRREAAGLSIEEAAAAVAGRRTDLRAPFARILRLWETEHCRAPLEDLEQLRRAFPFDPAVYGQLVDEPADRHPRVCRVCACSHWDPCEDAEHGGACGWSEADRCTRCAGALDAPGGVSL